MMIITSETVPKILKAPCSTRAHEWAGY